MTISIIFALLLVITTFYIHLLALKMFDATLPKLSISKYNQVLVIVISLFWVHIIEVGLYAIFYDLSITVFKLGALKGESINNFMEYFYYSMVTYTSLGIGDVYPSGHLRFITGIEALNGLMLITWSASYTFLLMKRLWPSNP